MNFLLRHLLLVCISNACSEHATSETRYRASATELLYTFDMLFPVASTHHQVLFFSICNSNPTLFCFCILPASCNRTRVKVIGQEHPLNVACRRHRMACLGRAGAAFSRRSSASWPSSCHPSCPVRPPPSRTRCRRAPWHCTRCLRYSASNSHVRVYSLYDIRIIHTVLHNSKYSASYCLIDRIRCSLNPFRSFATASSFRFCSDSRSMTVFQTTLLYSRR